MDSQIKKDFKAWLIKVELDLPKVLSKKDALTLAYAAYLAGRVHSVQSKAAQVKPRKGVIKS